MNSRVVIDSSVWIAAHRNPESAVTTELRRLIRSQLAVGVGPVLAELLVGARHDQLRRRAFAAFGAIAYLEADYRTWGLAGDMGRRLGSANLAIGFADLIIAALAIQHGLALYTLDRDFERIEGLRLHQPDGAKPA